VYFNFLILKTLDEFLVEITLVCDSPSLLLLPLMGIVGVQVQEEVLGELHRGQAAALNVRDLPRQDLITRAKIASKLIKYPNVEDYAVSRLTWVRLPADLPPDSFERTRREADPNSSPEPLGHQEHPCHLNGCFAKEHCQSQSPRHR